MMNDDGKSHLHVGGETEHVLWVVLTILYSSLCLLVIVQLLRIIIYRHNVVSFQGGFLSLCLVWSGLRLLFWFSNTFQWPEWVQLLCYWLPNLLQFATFSDLVVFYYKLVHIRDWKRLRRKVWAIYCAANVIVTAALGVWLWLFQVVDKNEANKEDVVAFYYSIFSGVTFGILMLLISYYGWRVFKIRLTRRMRLYHPFASTTVMVGLTFLVFVVFLTRCIYGLLQAAGGHAMSDPVGSRREQYKTLPQAVDVATFVLLILWELLPTFALVMLFRRIPRTKNNLFAMCCDKYCRAVPHKLSTVDESLDSQRETLLENPVGSVNHDGASRQIDTRLMEEGSYKNSSDETARNGSLYLPGSEGPSANNSPSRIKFPGGGFSTGLAKPPPSPARKFSNALLGDGTIFENANRYDSDGDSSPYGYGSISVTPGTPLFLGAVGGPMLGDGKSFDSKSLHSRHGSGASSMSDSMHVSSHTSPYDLLNSVTRGPSKKK